MSRKSDLEAKFARLVVDAGLSVGMVVQHRFHPPRRWTFDFAWPNAAVAVEIEGQPFTRPGTFRDLAPEAEKFATAMLLGWKVLRVPAKWLSTPRDTEGDCEAIVWTRALLEQKETPDIAAGVSR